MIAGITPCSIEVPVNVKVIDRSMPVFDKQFYTDSVLESIEVHSPLALSIQAESPLNRKLIYSITKGNDFEEFALDFNTGELTRGDTWSPPLPPVGARECRACILR